jgi:hypothetical protein
MKVVEKNPYTKMLSLKNPQAAPVTDKRGVTRSLVTSELRRAGCRQGISFLWDRKKPYLKGKLWLLSRPQPNLCSALQLDPISRLMASAWLPCLGRVKLLSCSVGWGDSGDDKDMGEVPLEVYYKGTSRASSTTGLCFGSSPFLVEKSGRQKKGWESSN